MTIPRTKEELMKRIEKESYNYTPSFFMTKETTFTDGSKFAIPLAIQMCLEKLRSIEDHNESGNWLEQELKREWFL